jgi:hypothetical protein
MINIKKFIEKVSYIESRQGKDVVIPISEARGLRDELSKLLVDLYDDKKNKEPEDTFIKVEVKGGSFK